MKEKGNDIFNKTHQFRSLQSQLTALRRELRETLQAYEARLEIKLAEIVNELAALKVMKSVPRERFQKAENFIALLRTYKAKPQRGRRKDLRKIEKFINDLRETLSPNLPR